MKADDINHPKHYGSRFGVESITCTHITRDMGFDSGNAFKYVWRAGAKDDLLKDLGKAQWYLRDILYFDLKDDPLHLFRYQGVFGLLKQPEFDKNPGLTEYMRYEILHRIVHEDYAGAAQMLAIVMDDERKKRENSAAEGGNISANESAQEN